MPPPHKPTLTLTSSTTLFDALILGAGPAGLSAALALSRVRSTAAVFSDGAFRNAPARHAHYVLSRDHQPAAEIRRLGREEVERYGTTRFVERSVVRAGRNEDGDATVFEVEDDAGEKWRGRHVVLATGARDEIGGTGIAGYEDCWGKSIHQCLFCDGLETSDLPAGVLGFAAAPRMTLHNIGLILQMGCPGVTIFGNGALKLADGDADAREALETAKAMGAEVDEREIERVEDLGDGKGMKLWFRDGSSRHLGFLSHKPITRLNARQVAEDLGVEVLPDGFGGEMLQRSEPLGESNVKGVFVAGDAGTVFKSFIGGMSQGVAAGVAVANGLLMERQKRCRSQNAVVPAIGDPR